MMKLVVRVKSVDMHSMCGRDHHPEPDMVGQLAHIDNVTTYCEDTMTVLNLADTTQQTGDAPVTFLHGVLADGREVDLVEWEVEVVSLELNCCV